MSDASLYFELHDPQHGHQLVSRGWEWSKQQLAAGRPVVAEFKLLEETRTIQLNKEYWGYVLKPISEQAQVNGIGSDAEGWHYYYKKMFLGYHFTKLRVPGSKRVVVRRELRSTTDLKVRRHGGDPDPSKYMVDYMEAVRAHAATTFDVSFPARERDTGPPQKASPKSRTVIDMETGEVISG